MKAQRKEPRLLERAKGPRVLEKHIEQAIVDYLTLDGWICRKQEQNFSEKKRKIVGELGMPDQQCVRYCDARHSVGMSKQSVNRLRASPELFWIEVKRERGGEIGSKAEKARIDQKAWHARERERGALTVILGEDCPATVDGFIEWYALSGLQRRNIQVRSAS